MFKLVIAYVATGIVFVAMDAAFLSLAGPRLYKPHLAPLLAGEVRAAPAVAFYLLYVAGLIVFCVQPGLGEGWRKALFGGAFFGLVAYGTYDLTCQAVMRVWSTPVTLADMAWGAVASGAASLAGVQITRFALQHMGSSQ